MVSRQPDTLSVTYRQKGTYSDGNYTPGLEVTHLIKGRKEANGQGQMIRDDNGAQIVYTWTFYCKPQTFEAPHGSVAVLNYGEWAGTVKRQSNGQLGTQIWL